MPDPFHGFGPQLLEGAGLTLLVTAASLLLGSIMGLAGATAKLSNYPVLRIMGASYTTIIRGVPDLLIIFIIFFGGTVTLTAVFGRYVEVNAYWSGVIALGTVFGAYATEIFRGSLLAVPPGQSEAAKALGLGPLRTFVKIVLPQAWRIALPAYGNQLLVLLKQTSLVSLIGLEELMRKGKIAVGATDEPFTFYFGVGLIYLVMTTCLTIILKRAENAAALVGADR